MLSRTYGLLSVTDISQAFGGTQAVSAIIVVVLLIVAGLLTRLRGRIRQNQGRGGLVMGWDRRLSTSKTIAVLWTAVVAYMIISLVIIATSQSDFFLKDLLNKAPDLYLVFLGGPYAAAILAKVGVTQNMQTGRLQKSDGSGVLNPADLISNDTGATDLYDFQYTVFNLIAMLAVLTAFIPHPAKGFPQIPDFLAILTGGAALTYTLNKTVTTNPPSISTVDPDHARIKDFVTIYGANLYDPNATGSSTVLKVGGVKVPSSDLLEFTDHLTFRLPPVPLGAQDLDLTTNAGGSPATTGAGGSSVPKPSITLLPDVPVVSQVSTNHVKAGDALTLYGRFFYPAPKLDVNGNPTDRVNDTSVDITLGSGASLPCPVDPNRTASDTEVTVTIPPAAVAPGATDPVTTLTIRGNSPIPPPAPLEIIG